MNNMIALSWPYQVRTFSFHKWDEWIPLKTKLSPFSRAVDHFWKAVDRYVKPYHCSMCTNDCFMIKIHVQLLMVACSQNSLFSLMGKNMIDFQVNTFIKDYSSNAALSPNSAIQFMAIYIITEDGDTLYTSSFKWRDSCEKGD